MASATSTAAPSNPPSANAAPTSFALITPSFAPDFERCRLLCDSVRAHVPATVRHYIIVDQRDVPLFSSLRSPQTELITVESIVPWWLRRVPFAGRWWLSLKTPPVRNWMLQQIVKLSSALFLREDVLIFVDSDTFFVDRFVPEHTVRAGRVPLFRERGDAVRSSMSERWLTVASELIGTTPTGEPLSYVGNLITWRRENVLALHKHIERTHGRPWVQAICRQPTLSEYVLYGCFCEQVLGDASGHYVDDSIPSLNYWKTDTLDAAGLSDLKAQIRPEHVAVMVSAKSATPVQAIRSTFFGGTRATGVNSPGPWHVADSRG